MPRKPAKRKSKRRTYKKKDPYELKMGVSSGIAPIRTVSLRYSENVVLTSTFGVVSTIGYRANGLADPRADLGGHQPMGFDEWSAQYNYYVVTRSKIRFILSDGTNQVEPYVCGVYLDDNNFASYTSSSGFLEARKGTYKVSTGKQATPLHVTSTFDSKKYFHVTDVKDNIDTLGALITADPQNQAYYMLWMQGFNGVTNAINVTVIIDYVAVFSEPVTIDQS